MDVSARSLTLGEPPSHIRRADDLPSPLFRHAECGERNRRHSHEYAASRSRPMKARCRGVHVEGEARWPRTGFGQTTTHVAITESTTPDDGYLGSWIDEERSEMRYVMRIAELRESSSP